MLSRSVRQSVADHVSSPVQRFGGFVNAFLVVGIPSYDIGFETNRELDRCPARNQTADDVGTGRFEGGNAQRIEAHIKRFWSATDVFVAGNADPSMVLPPSNCSWLNSGTGMTLEGAAAWFQARYKMLLAYRMVQKQEQGQLRLPLRLDRRLTNGFGI